MLKLSVHLFLSYFRLSESGSESVTKSRAGGFNNSLFLLG
jgi:hypothetical protein